MSLHIGKTIKSYVDSKGFTNRDFATKMEMSENNIYKIFRKESIDTALLEKISQLLEIPITTFFTKSLDTQYSSVTGDSNFTIANSKNTDVGNTIDSKKSDTAEKDLLNCQKEVELLKQSIRDKEMIIELLKAK